MIKKLLSLILLLNIYGIHAQDVNIPDANFKAELVGNPAINTNNDSEIQISEAQAFSQTIDVTNKGISDLTGIEAFVNLDRLLCNGNNLSSINLSQNTVLRGLQCARNKLTTLDVTINVNLMELFCGQNNLNKLNLTRNKLLVLLSCNTNSITSIDVSRSTNLENLSISNNGFTTIDVSKNIELASIDCFNNALTSLDLSNIATLKILNCNNNNLTSLDITNNPNLERLVCSSNNLLNLNIANGNNLNFNTMNASSNPNLSCINIDAGFNPPNTWIIDATASYSKDCTILSLDDKIFEDSVSIFPNPVTNQLYISTPHSEKMAVEVYNILSKKIISTTNTRLVDVSDLSKGIYLLKLTNSNNGVSIIKRFVKE